MAVEASTQTQWPPGAGVGTLVPALWAKVASAVAEVLEIGGDCVEAFVDAEGRTLWSVAHFVNALHGKGRKDAQGRIMVHRFTQEKSAQKEVMTRHCHEMRRAGSRGPRTPAMKAYGLLRLLRVMKFKRNLAVMRRVTDAQERLMGLDRE